MIIVASERGSAKELAAHLLNDHDGNEHVTVKELRGFISEDLENALEESYAISRGTKSKKYLFSVSFNPPAHEDVPIEIFEDAIRQVEEKCGLVGQPRAIVFHEKNGRRHAHVVWSRIDAQTMTARNLSHYKLKLQTISRELYHEHEWKLPAGFVRKGQGNPRNYTYVEYEQSKRMKIDPRDLKGAIQDAYAASDNCNSFAHALAEQGFILAKGDRRAHVAVSHSGEVLSVARYVGRKAKDVRAKLGEPDDLPSVDAAKTQMANDMRSAFKRHSKEASKLWQHTNAALEQTRVLMVESQRTERHALNERHKEQWIEETKMRSERLHHGLKAVWQFVTGQRRSIQERNKQEAISSLARHKSEQEELQRRHIRQRRELQLRIVEARNKQAHTLHEIRKDRSDVSRAFSETKSRPTRRRRRKNQDHDWEPEI